MTILMCSQSLQSIFTSDVVLPVSEALSAASSMMNVKSRAIGSTEPADAISKKKQNKKTIRSTLIGFFFTSFVF